MAACFSFQRAVGTSCLTLTWDDLFGKLGTAVNYKLRAIVMACKWHRHPSRNFMKKKKKKATKIFFLLQSIKQCVPCTNRDPFKHSGHTYYTYVPHHMPILCFPVHMTLINVDSPLHMHPENGAPWLWELSVFKPVKSWIFKASLAHQISVLWWEQKNRKIKRGRA